MTDDSRRGEGTQQEREPVRIIGPVGQTVRLPRVCRTCHYCRMDTDAESVAMYGRALGYGTCYRESGGWTVKAPGAQSCDRWWSPLEATPATTREEGDEHADR